GARAKSQIDGQRTVLARGREQAVCEVHLIGIASEQVVDHTRHALAILLIRKDPAGRPEPWCRKRWRRAPEPREQSLRRGSVQRRGCNTDHGASPPEGGGSRAASGGARSAASRSRPRAVTSRTKARK